MKRILSFLLAAILACSVLTGCSHSKDPDTSLPPPPPMPTSTAESTAFPETPDDQPNEPTPPEAPRTMPEWQVAYINLLNQLIREHGRSSIDATSHMATPGIRAARLLDFNEDGVRELVVVLDRTVQLYTASGKEAKLLYKGEIGIRLGQSDVSYSFLLNSHSTPITLLLPHSSDEWNEEAITLISLDEKGSVKQRELLARSSLHNDIPTLDNMNEFYIDGSLVEKEEYMALRDSVTEGALEIMPDFGDYPATSDEVSALIQTLMKSDPADYVLPDSDCRVMTQEEIAALNTRQLRLARNEIYARYGRIFTAPEMKAYFSELPWYQPRYTPEQMDEFGEVGLNQYELANLELIQQAEESGTAPLAEDLTEEQAEAIAVSYWDFVEGSLDEATGSLKAISSDGLTTDGGENVWAFRLRRMVDNNHWSTMERIHVNAQTGLVTNPNGQK